MEQERNQMMAQQAEADRQFEMKKHDDTISVQREKIAASLELGHLKEIATDGRHSIDRVDTDRNGIDDFLDLRRTDIDEEYKNQQIQIAQDKLAETIRANKASEQIAKEKVTEAKKATK
jgi:hypothetical protein